MPGGCMVRPAGVATLRQVVHEGSEVFAMRTFPCPGHGKDRHIVWRGDQPQGLVGGTHSLSDRQDLPCPDRGYELLQHLPQEDILMPCDVQVQRGEGHWKVQTAPPRHEQDHLKPTRIRRMRAMTRRMFQGMFVAALVLHRAISYARQVAGAMARTTASVCHGSERIIRNGVHYVSVGGRDAWSPLHVPVPGARLRPSAPSRRPDSVALGRSARAS